MRPTCSCLPPRTDGCCLSTADGDHRGRLLGPVQLCRASTMTTSSGVACGWIDRRRGLPGRPPASNGWPSATATSTACTTAMRAVQQPCESEPPWEDRVRRPQGSRSPARSLSLEPSPIRRSSASSTDESRPCRNPMSRPRSGACVRPSTFPSLRSRRCAHHPPARYAEMWSTRRALP